MLETSRYLSSFLFGDKTDNLNHDDIRKLTKILYVFHAVLASSQVNDLLKSML